MNDRDEGLPSRRLVLLGASNVRMSLAAAIHSARHLLGEPLDVLVAAGHGRSYGQMTRVLGRQLTGITQCGLWSALARREWGATDALITDIGNDLLFGASPEQIVAWVGQCVERLLEADARVVITHLPLSNFDSISPLRFRLFRSVLFPGNRETLSALKCLAAETDRRLTEMAVEYSVSMVDSVPHWYGLDPIHLKYRYWSDAYALFFTSWSADSNRSPRRVAWREHVRAATWRGDERIMFGRRRRREQPCACLRDGSRVSLY